MTTTAEATEARASAHAAFRASFQQELPYVMHTLRRLGVRERDLEDLAHDVFVTFYRRIGEYDAARPLRPWLFGIAFRTAAGNRNRKAAANEVLADADADARAHGAEPADSAPGPDAQLEAHRRRQLVLEGLDLLEPDRKAVLILHDLDGTAMPEVADALGLALNTGYSRLRLAREDFKAAIRRIQARGSR